MMEDNYIMALMIAEVIISALLVITILLQPGSEDGGFVFGGSASGGESFRTKRGLEKFLYRATIVLAVLFAALSFLIVKYTN